MKRYEVEALVKNFLIFFSLELLLLSALFIKEYKQDIHTKLDSIENEMKVCSFHLECPKFDLDFVPKKTDIKTDYLYKDNNLTTYYKIPTVKEYLLKITLNKNSYDKIKATLKSQLAKRFTIYALIMAILSFLFSLYTLWPLKRALKLNDEFIKDILHDINTPISSIVINFKLLKKEFGQNRKIERVESSIDTILYLQKNLRTFLDSSKLQKEQLCIKDILIDRVEHFKHIYPNLNFHTDIEECKSLSNQEAFTRIIDNLLSNASKYNKEKGDVEVRLKNCTITIKDSGIGIENVNNIFKRYYTEHERGIGIGMHIVKKLCDALGIKISIKSKVNKGTTVTLNLISNV